MTSAFAIDPDLSVVLDVDFAETPTCPPRSALPIDAMIVTHGPFVQPKLNQRLIDCAKKHHVKLNANVASRSTGTDADEIGLSARCAERAAQPAGEVHAHVGGND